MCVNIKVVVVLLIKNLIVSWQCTLYHITQTDRLDGGRTVMVVEDTMLVEYMTSTELNILRHGRVVRSTKSSQSVLDVVDEALRHERILVEVHQVRCLQTAHTLHPCTRCYRKTAAFTTHVATETHESLLVAIS